MSNVVKSEGERTVDVDIYATGTEVADSFLEFFRRHRGAGSSDFLSQGYVLGSADMDFRRHGQNVYFFQVRGPANSHFNQYV